MALTLLRHLTPDVAKGTCYGVTDLDLAPGWDIQADVLRAKFGGGRPIFTSPLKRCRYISDNIGKSTISPALREMDFGTWEGQLWDDIPRAELDEWAADFFHARPHGGESVAMLRDRVARFLGDVPDGALLVTHNGVIKAIAALCGLPNAWDTSLRFGGSLDVDKPVGEFQF